MNLLLTGAFPYTEEQKRQLEMLGYSLLFVQDERRELSFDVSKIEAIVCNGLFLYNDIQQFEALKFIQLTSAGLDRAPLPYIREKNIQLYNARGVFSVPMAEWTVCKVLDYYKQSDYFRKMQNALSWTKNRDIKELSGRTVGIIGGGSVGLEVAKRFKAFDMTILVADLYEVYAPFVNQYFHIDDIMQFLPLCDVLVLTVPLTEQTYHWIDKRKLGIMKPEAVFVNISRGAVIHEKEFIEALRNKEIAYAALDVFEEEPLSENNLLWRMDNVSVSPHNSFVSDRNNIRLFDLIYSNLKQFVLEQKEHE